MITNSSSIGPGGPSGPDPRRSRPATSAASAPAGPSDRLSTDRATNLNKALENTPALRPEVVRRAEALAIDPNYPPLQIIERVARMIAASQDASEIPD